MKENWKDKIAFKVSNQLLRLQARFAQALERKIANISFNQIKILLIVFCLVWGGLSALFIVQALRFQKRHNISIDPIHMPKYSTKTGEPINPTLDTIKNKK